MENPQPSAASRRIRRRATLLVAGAIVVAPILALVPLVCWGGSDVATIPLRPGAARAADSETPPPALQEIAAEWVTMVNAVDSLRHTRPAPLILAYAVTTRADLRLVLLPGFGNGLSAEAEADSLSQLAALWAYTLATAGVPWPGLGHYSPGLVIVRPPPLGATHSHSSVELIAESRDARTILFDTTHVGESGP